VFDLPRVLAEIPDVAFLVLGVPVEGILHQLPINPDPVPEHDALDAYNPLGVVGNTDFDALEAFCVLPLVDERGAGFQRKVLVVDFIDEVGGIYVWRIGFFPFILIRLCGGAIRLLN
jgi:hypothetical protein